MSFLTNNNKKNNKKPIKMDQPIFTPTKMGNRSKGSKYYSYYTINHANKLSIVTNMLAYYPPNCEWAIGKHDSEFIVENDLNKLNLVLEEKLPANKPNAVIHLWLTTYTGECFSFLMFPFRDFDDSKRLEPLGEYNKKSMNLLYSDIEEFVTRRLSYGNEKVELTPIKVCVPFSNKNIFGHIMRYLKHFSANNGKYYVNYNHDCIIFQPNEHDFSHMFAITSEQICDYSPHVFSVEHGFQDNYSNNKLYKSLEEDFISFKRDYREKGTSAWPLRKHF